MPSSVILSMRYSLAARCPSDPTCLSPCEVSLKTSLFNLSIAEESGKKINIAVAEFEARNVSSMDAATVSDFIRTELVRSRLFKVLDRNNMAMVLEEQQFQLSGCTTQECAVQMGKLLNVKCVVIGNMTKLADSYYITASVIDIESGEIAYSERIEAPTAQDIISASEELGKTLASLISGQEVRIVSAVSRKQDRVAMSKIDTKKKIPRSEIFFFLTIRSTRPPI